jgi:hypothetical protein
MSEWWTYRLTSFLLFAPRTYHRLFELYNQAIWPAQIAAFATGVAIVALLVGGYRHRDRLVAGLLAAGWLWVAWAFLYQRYAQINWVAPWFAAAFALQALLLAGGGAVANRIAFKSSQSLRSRFAIALTAIVVAGYPLLAPLTGRSWTTAEAFGVAPDPTAIATAAVLALVRRPMLRWLLLAIPLAACTIAALTQWAMGASEAVVVAAAALVALILAL